MIQLEINPSLKFKNPPNNLENSNKKQIVGENHFYNSNVYCDICKKETIGDYFVNHSS